MLRTIALALLLTACERPSPTPVQPDGGRPSAVRTRCPTGHAFDFRARGKGFTAHEGRRVWAVAIERDQHDEHGRMYAVRLEGTITAGAFDLTCPDSLDANYAYPGWVVVVDADGDGRCGPSDLHTKREHYGWDFDVIVDDVTPDQLSTIREAHTVIGDRSTFDFCALYFQ